MTKNSASLERLIRGFTKMYHNCLRVEFDRRGLGDIGNPAILFILRDSCKQDNPISQKEIADLLGIAAPTVAVTIKRMENAGLITKVSDQDDLRKNCISLSEKGRMLTEDCMLAERELCKKVVSGFSPDELDTLKQFYLRMTENMIGLGARQSILQEDR